MDALLRQFILDHENDDPVSLLLSRQKWPDIDVSLAVNCISSRKKIREKLPFWYQHPDVIYPDSLPAQQCSSEETARYKSDLVLRICGSGRKIADLTGGLGVDSYFFSRVCSSLLYNEMNPSFASAAEHNFKVLGADNITVRNVCLEPGKLGTILDGFNPDIIYLDPARRSCDGRKVFMLSDCSPDIVSLEEELLRECRHMLVKLSPMADITMICRQLGTCCREVHITGSEGECKELLVWIDREWKGPYRIVCGCIDFTVEDEKTAVPVFGDTYDCGLLYEPGKALMKSACFNLISARYGLKKLAASTHLYLASEDISEELVSLGKVFEIQEVVRFNKQNIKLLASKYPGADVTSRNLPVTSDELKKRMKSSSKPVYSAAFHIFAAATLQGNLFFVTKRIR